MRRDQFSGRGDGRRILWRPIEWPVPGTTCLDGPASRETSQFIAIAYWSPIAMMSPTEISPCNLTETFHALGCDRTDGRAGGLSDWMSWAPPAGRWLGVDSRRRERSPRKSVSLLSDGFNLAASLFSVVFQRPAASICATLSARCVRPTDIAQAAATSGTSFGPIEWTQRSERASAKKTMHHLLSAPHPGGPLFVLAH